MRDASQGLGDRTPHVESLPLIGDLTGGNVRAVQRFSRHRDVRVLERYDDNRRDLGGEVAKQVAASVPGDTLAS